jgi:Bacterial protein of unknown function (DUF899)
MRRQRTGALPKIVSGKTARKGEGRHTRATRPLCCVPRPAAEHFAIPEAHGLDRAMVFVRAERLQCGLWCRASERRDLRSQRLPPRRQTRRAYFTTKRGVEALGSTWTFLDLTPLGRQENLENSPKGWPQTPPYEWWRRHDEYDTGRRR